MAVKEGKLREIFLAIGKRPDIAASVFRAVASGSWSGPSTVASICSASHLPLTRQADVEAVLSAAAESGLFLQRTPLTWSVVGDASEYDQLACMFAGASLYAQFMRSDFKDAEVILTKPSKPSMLERALSEAGYEHVGVTATDEMFNAMATGATQKFTIMTPFLDSHGGQRAVDLFGRTKPEVTRTLVVRSDVSGLPKGCLEYAEPLRQMNVRVLDYRLEREGSGFETFHAKVILADRNFAYVGSANMNQWSLAYSMELGVSLRGLPAARIARVVAAVTRIAKPIV